jgi:hypothetical protein
VLPAHRFGVLLKAFSKAAGLIQEALAERAGPSTRGLQDLERGVHQTALGLSARDHAEIMAAAPAPASAALLGFAAGDPLPLVGRERELALLERILEGTGAAVEGRGCCCWPASRASARRVLDDNVDVPGSVGSLHPHPGFAVRSSPSAYTTACSGVMVPPSAHAAR